MCVSVVHTGNMIPFGTTVLVVVLGTLAFEVIYLIVLAYHWFRFGSTNVATFTLLAYGIVTLILLALLAVLAAAIAL